MFNYNLINGAESVMSAYLCTPISMFEYILSLDNMIALHFSQAYVRK